MPPLKPVSRLTSQYLRKVGLPQALPIGTGYTHQCDCINTRPIHPDKVRFGFIPDNWFAFFYPKTGITGPYIFGLGLLNYLFSKEIYVCDHEFYNGLAMAILSTITVKMLGPKVANYCDREIEKIENNWKKNQKDELEVLRSKIACERLEQWRAEGSLLLLQAKKENIAVQLEAAYRQALWEIHNDVLRRLDYQVDCCNIEKRINHKHMVAWLVKNITRQLPKDTDKKQLQKHKEVLSALALKIQ